MEPPVAAMQNDYDLNSASTIPAANGVVAVLLSTGRATGVSSFAQDENTTAVLNQALPFNDIVVWISATEIVGELIKAQVLP